MTIGTNQKRAMPVFTQRFDGLVQERRNSSALAMELCLSCTNPSIYQLESDPLVQAVINPTSPIYD